MKKNIFIIGGSSYLGKLLINSLLNSKNYKIYSSYNKNKNISNKNIEFIELDINKFNSDFLDKIPKKIDSLILLSWVDLTNYNSDKHRYFSNNLLNFLKFLLSKVDIKTINAIGSCLEYGLVHGEISEDKKCLPVTKYGKQKLFVLNKILKLKNKYNFQFNWMRIFYMYGDKRNRGIWSQFLISKNNNLIFKMSGGQQQFDFLHINKIIKYISSIIQIDKNFGVINICSGKPKKLISLVRNWAYRYKVKLKIGYYPYTTYESMSYWGCNCKLNNILRKHE